jgi:antirestriction protein ArdC
MEKKMNESQSTNENREEGKRPSFRVSKELQADFVLDVFKEVNSLCKFTGNFERPWQDKPVGLPYNPATGAAFSGANMARLLLEEAKMAYGDNRWVTSAQLNEIRQENPDKSICIRKGEHSVKLLRPESTYFAVLENAQWKPIKAEDFEKAPAGSQIVKATVFYPYYVFNAAQIAGFPAKQRQRPALTEENIDKHIANFAVCSGVEIKAGNKAGYSPDDDSIVLPAGAPLTQKFSQLFAATGHCSRENRMRDLGAGAGAGAEDGELAKNKETARNSVASILIGSVFGVKPEPLDRESVAAIVAVFTREPKEAFRVVADAAKFVKVFADFTEDRQPAVTWMPDKKEWPGLIGKSHATKREKELSSLALEFGTSAVSIHSQLHPPTDSVPTDRSRVDCPLPEGRDYRNGRPGTAERQEGISGEKTAMPTDTGETVQKSRRRPKAG